MENRRLVAEFQKNSVEKVKVITYEWKGQDLCDVRVWIQQDPTDPKSEIATKKGITIRVELLPDLINALQKAEKTLNQSKESSA